MERSYPDRTGEAIVGLGCMRLSNVDRTDDDFIGVVHAALDAGARLLDTARVYGPSEGQDGHNERLVARALASWKGDRGAVTVATKAGMTRAQGRWVPDGRARSLEADCEASLEALGLDRLPLLQLHAPDPRTSFASAIRALERLRGRGLCEAIGVCNVSAAELAVACSEGLISTVQVALSCLDDRAFRGGVVAMAIERGIRILAHSPLGGPARARAHARDPLLAELAAAHRTTPQMIALAWLSDLSASITPIPGATRPETAAALARLREVSLGDRDRARLDERFAAAARALGRAPTFASTPTADEGEVVLLMGIPGAGKSTQAESWAGRGYDRLNRDTRGGKLSRLLPELERGLSQGRRRWVLDNTYATRASRDEVIEVAARHGVATRVVWIDTPLPEAQVNACRRLYRRYGELPAPERLKELSKGDPHAFPPLAQFRFEREVEPPSEAEGHARVERVTFVRESDPHLSLPGLFLNVGALLQRTSAASLRVSLAALMGPGVVVVGFGWRPDPGLASLAELHESLGLELDVALCPHAGGPPVCWCRPPLPGLLVALAERHGIDFSKSSLVGRSQVDRTMARRLGMTFVEQTVW